MVVTGVPLGFGGTAFMVCDLVVFGLVGYYFFYKIAYDRRWQMGKLGVFLIAMWSVMLISLIFGSTQLLLKESIASALYLLRFVAYTALYFVVKDTATTTKQQRGIMTALLSASLLTALLGFAQLTFFANFYKLRWYEYGWDPHINRLTSTWLDPNYVGGYFACAIIILSSLAVYSLQQKKWGRLSFLAIGIGTLLMALVMTYSRSSYLALMTGVFFLGLIRLRKLFFITIIAGLLIFSSSTRLQQRVNDAKKDEKERLQKIEKQEERVNQRETAIQNKIDTLEKKLDDIKKKEEVVDKNKEESEAFIEKQKAQLAEVAKYTPDQAKEELLKLVESESKELLNERYKEIEEEVREDSEKKARNIIVHSIQKIATDVISESTLTTVPIPSDDMKGRIIGKEGRNINAFEQLTGVDVIVDDTPGAVLISGFDLVRRYIAKRALEELVEDGRIHPTRIEEAVEKSKYPCPYPMQPSSSSSPMSVPEPLPMPLPEPDCSDPL